MVNGYIYRTAVTRLKCGDREGRLLVATIDEWLHACQIATDAAWDDCYNKRNLQTRIYDQIRDRTALKSEHVLLAIHRAAEAVKSCVERRNSGYSVSKPQFTSPTIVYDSKTMTTREDNTITLATINSRVRAELALPNEEDGYQYRYLENDRWELTESTLHYRSSVFYLHLGFKRAANTGTNTAEDRTVLGVDLGLDNLAVTSTAWFYSGGKLDHYRRELARTRGGLTHTQSRSGHRTLRKIDNREERHVNDVLHQVANGVVEEAITHDCSVIAMEDLDKIRERLPAGPIHYFWAFRRLMEYIEYKAEDIGIQTRSVDAAYTSQKCADCGYIDEKNRVSRTRFLCQNCGKETNADYNAAKNIAANCVRTDQQSSARTGVSRYALKSGVVIPDRGFVPR